MADSDDSGDFSVDSAGDVDVTSVQIGVSVPPAHRRVFERQYFPCKAGGPPAWLDDVHIPSPTCLHCSQSLTFLLQIYAPGKVDGAFHRTLFAFLCTNPACYHKEEPKTCGCIRVFRGQLPRKNDYLSFDPPPEINPDTPETKAALDAMPAVAPGLFTESELLIEGEPELTAEMRKKAHSKEMELLRAYEKEARGDAEDDAHDGMDETVFRADDDPAFAAFMDRVARVPDQVLRYERNGAPLWISSMHEPATDDIKPCSCGAPRTFECQIMPQLLHVLHVDTQLGAQSIDWGTVAVYTCSADCDTNVQDNCAYREELTWKQTISS
eukprot:TRINITY_DN900_c0_g1_i2.p1 TRINITY_DN900_c0_g1~~TRINITY_DN900_c0_g1_i2.p1  ORF type:complete len:340 (+),score=60.14 TRINITY_DN900_c0_g1_i2:47-1021(+)